MIRAIIFDCFGVLTTDGWLPFKNRYFSSSQELWKQASDLNKNADAGLINYDHYIQEIARLANVSEQETRYQIENNHPDQALLTYIEKNLKPSYKLGMLSNAGQNWLDKIFDQEHIKLFDEIVLSYELGITKPDRRAYVAIAERLGVEPRECIFIDDQRRFCEGARAAGMPAIVYESLDQLKGELKSYLLSN